MTTLLIAALAACAAAGAVLVVTGLTGRSVLDVPSEVLRPARLSVTRAAGPLAVSAVCFGATGWPLASALVATGCAFLPRLLGGRRERRQAIDRTEAIASWTEMIRDSITAAAGLEEAIAATAPVAPPALRVAVARLVRRLDHERLAEALARFGRDVRHPSCDLVVAALILAARLEANDLSGLLSRLADSARDEARMRIRIEVGRTRIRTATAVIVGVVVAAVGLLAVGNRGYLDAYSSSTGQLVLAIVAAIFGAGGWLLVRMAEISMPERFVSRLDTAAST